MMWKTILVLSLSLALSRAQLILEGQCDPNILLQEDFNVTEFLGRWFVVRRSTSNYITADCSYMELTQESNSLAVYNKGVNENFLEEINAQATLEPGTAKLNFRATNSTENVDFWILTTDYNNLALSYSCENRNDTHKNLLLWQLGRTTSFPTNAMEALLNNTLVTRLNVTSNDLSSVDHSTNACNVLPEIPLGQPVILPDQCDPDINVVQNFSISAFMGLWHQISSYYSVNGQGTCNRAEYSLSGNVVNVLNSQVVNKYLEAIEGNATVTSNDGSARLSVTLEVAPGVLVESPLFILATDYTNYAVAYVCTNEPNNHRRVIAWIASRSPQLSPQAQSDVNDVIRSQFDLNNRYFILANQTNEGCFFYPTPAPNQPVRFRGQCNENIQVVQNFNATAYQGLWHSIESYPSLFTPGTCNNALYTLRENDVKVFNTQVINQTLDTVNGVAVITSTDGSGKLDVTFPVVGTNLTVTTQYWVLQTNYENYALVYSCSNDDDDRKIFSWKLSREKVLREESIDAINAVIATVPELDQQYYEFENQSPDGCFYYPEPQPGVPVRFPGQCGDISVQTNFNLTAFQGIWYETQAYPTEQQPGQCISHNFSQDSDRSFTLVTSSVIDQFPSVSNSTVTLNTNDSSAKMTLTTAWNGGAIEIPYWIVSTDYDNYTLAYSCVSVASDFKMVYSWKLSRTPQLLSESASAISNASQNVPVLQERYYENIDQSENACRTLPEIALGSPIILDGQCDPNIPVVQNFNPTRYRGRWRMIESYYQESQTGQCNQAEYSLYDDNSITVYNNQVINQGLDDITGTATLASNDSSAKLVVSFPTVNNSAELWILDTDYESYSLVYSCRNLDINHRRVYSWKLSRTTTLSIKAIENINQIVNNIDVLNNRYYYEINHSDNACFYFPKPDLDSYITFRGQCDMNIPVVTNFNTSAYIGQWYDISSYPTREQQGTCNSALYTLDDNTFSILNTQVIDQTLRSTSLSARSSTTDNSAKFMVSFPSETPVREVPYWVLDTDYESYALAYSCINVDEEYRRVSSWKLSRTKQLSTNSTASINNIVNTIQVLDDRYYINRNHRDEGCFYYPEPQPGVPVVFPGQCDQSIQAISNFNMSMFEGIWHEIEAYPKDQQSGQCINHMYTLSSDNTLSLISSNILDQLQRISNSSVTFASAQDTSGKLTITINSESNIVIPFWILDTDYNDYALAYSCVNRDENSRAVYSWKLSRSKQLSQNGNNLINNKIAEINVLQDSYYEALSQSDDACFFLPNVVPGEPVVFTGQCDPNIDVVQNFDPVAYSGRWRMIESYASDFQDSNATCSEATYTLEGSVVDVVNTQVIDQDLDVINGNATLATTDGSAKLYVNFPNSPGSSDYWVLSTDYSSYALVYSCRNINNEQRRVYSWKLSRTRELSANATAEINSALNNVNVLNQQYFSRIEHSDSACFYYPVPDGNPLKFRGQCDESIPVVTNFNATAYMNTWYDIESYPVRFQDGTCPTATYTLSSSVEVYNTQVVEQQLDTINGNAVFAGDANVAKLIVSFPVAGTNLTTNSPYWVLSTDYNDYALVYSCSNIDDEYFSASSWKLSRTKQLSTNSTASINNIVNTIQVLDDRYYINRNHRDEGCFYYPEPQPGVPVVFPGQCDQSIQAISNFNMSMFQGIWHEIEAYPKDQQSGQCINHIYTLSSDNTLSLISSNILDQLQRISNSSVTFASAQDTSGKLTITLNSESNIVIPFWILDTDYNDYALAYSCVNRDENSRAVYSWKLSRSKQLSQNSNNLINNKIAEINVLHDSYYEALSQSDDACFFLPNVVPGEPVVFTGQCDPNIDVVQNFDPVAYSGRWRMIESYASDFQDSNATCSEATYTLEGSVVDVVNTQVIDQDLDVINGNATLATTDGSAKLYVNFPNSPGSSDYWVLSTDYSSYALVYSCRNINNEQRRVYSWKLSRTRELSANATAEINSALNNVNVLNQQYFSRIEHSDSACFYYPVPDGNPLKFRGQCDESIPVVTNFNATAYMNTWYDIESYPVRFQDGTCPTATYTLSSSVEVYNTQVVEQQLDTINGNAVFAGDANVAKLIVSFPVAGTNLTTNSPYWVLSTDYNDYALVYSCSNIDDEYFSASSWKLSRTKQLSTNSTASINNIVNTIQVLDDRYYINRNHRDEGCFYYPEPQPGVPVVFPGQCDQSIQAISNFNMSMFQGIWHEIEAYPKDQQSGQCINHIYTLSSDNTLSLISSNILDQLQRISNSSVTFASAQDTSGKLTITLNSESNIVIPFWILDTDYNDYALAYSCVNRDENSRAVYSWKLSRSKQLSQNSNNLINNKIAEINVLHDSYYEALSQSDDACFFLPNVVPGEPVVFTGQCDPNIDVVQNFDPVAYSGRWRMIESYASDFQDSSATCSEATYTLEGSVVDVVNTQVIDQDLDVINGNATLATTDGSAKLYVNFPNSPGSSDYWVLSTDYSSYALVYSCRNINNEQRRVYSWKLSRTRELSANATAEINSALNNVNVLNQQYFSRIEHSDSACFYYPVPDGNPLKFRGQCDESIPVVTNFNATAYMNTWYDIESYPVRFQDGTCPTATYTLSSSVEVYNTQVVEQQLDTINGNAVFAGDANVAKLTVSFPVAGTNLTTNSPYWVLSTDYNNYALVYSCRNIDDEYFNVSSWKLSRDKYLSNNARQAIDGVIDSIPVLRQNYYIERGHSDDDCFYYPDNNGGPVIQNGQCNFNDIPIVSNFDAASFAGKWYEISRYPSELQEGACVSFQFDINNQQFNVSKNTVLNERLISLTGVATPSQDGGGILEVNLSGQGASFETTLYVLDVNYTDFVLLYNCINVNNESKQVYSWKLSRSQEGLSSNAEARIADVVARTRDLFEGYNENTDQDNSGCFHYPEFDSPPSVIELIGPCDPSIRAKPNFSASDYLGKWYEIESYPQAFQSGDCSRAQYSLNDNGSVNVLNTQVINRTLDIQYATAVVASNDGSGLLEVTFEFENGVRNVVNYYVLETDYTGFALVYSCRNLSNGNRQVSSWKLSRYTFLPSQAIPIIDSIVSSTQGLNQEYYKQTNQSEEACFYVPELNKNEAPLFRGQCENIQGIQGFNAARFLGWWHEIESYPTNKDRGTCRSSEYSQVGNAYQVVDINVYGVSAQVNSGSVTISNNGRLTTADSDIWVLSTDYENYALLYSCENVDNNYRRVWSAKYSKSRNFQQTGSNDMDRVIQEMDTLDESLFYPVDQTDDACFYYPETIGESVILPGQCDPTIPVVQNFRIENYSGTWYQIERYPQVHESGDCVGARYTVNDNTGAVDVLNWQVIDGVLDTVAGNATIASTDGSAKLYVTLPIRFNDDPGPQWVLIELYVLDTDYLSYSLAYSCYNVSPYRRSIGAWKLSRFRTLTSEGTAAINGVIAARQELNQSYFLSVEQNDDCEEPSSAILVKSSIIVMIVCTILHMLW